MLKLTLSSPLTNSVLKYSLVNKKEHSSINCSVPMRGKCLNGECSFENQDLNVKGNIT